MSLKPCEVKIFQSWEYINPDFADDMKILRQSGELHRWLLKLKLMVDFIMFFRFFDLDAAQRKEFLQHYIKAAEKPLFKLDILAEKVEKALSRHLKKK